MTILPFRTLVCLGQPACGLLLFLLLLGATSHTARAGAEAGSAKQPSGYSQAAKLAAAVVPATSAEIDQWVSDQQFSAEPEAQDLLVYACAVGYAGVVKTLLGAQTVSADAASPGFGAWPVHAASYNNQLECLALLIEAGGDVQRNIGGDEGTPLHQAALGNATETAKLLLACGVDTEARNGLGVTALHDAANSNAVEVAGLLLAAGAQLDATTDQEGNTPLILAANANSLELGRILIDAGANMNFADPVYGLTPLHVTALRGYADFAQMLLKAGARRDLKDKDGATPADVARASGHPELAELLK